MRTALFVGCLCIALSVGFVVVGCGPSEGEAKGGAQTTCPMMGGKIDKKFYADHKGKRVYFCCDECPDKFKADADAMIKKMEDAGVVLEDAPKE